MTMTQTLSTFLPLPGQSWPEQGGIIVGHRMIEGVYRSVIIPGGTEYDVLASYNNAAERIAAKGEINGFADWHHGSLEDAMLAYMNVRDLFPHEGVESVQITSTPCGFLSAWAVAFVDGSVSYLLRRRELRVRPFRYV